MRMNKPIPQTIEHNMLMHNMALSKDKELPLLRKSEYVPIRLIAFNEALKSKDYESTVHFFIDDYQFERIWNFPERYIDKLSKFKAVISPDFSLYTGMSTISQLWNVYRNRFIGAYMQMKGIEVIPSLSWTEDLDKSFYLRALNKVV